MSSGTWRQLKKITTKAQSRHMKRAPHLRGFFYHGPRSQVGATKALFSKRAISLVHDNDRALVT